MFTFKLKQVLMLKERTEDMKMKELATVLGKQERIQASLDAIDHGIQSVLETKESGQNQVIDFNHIRMCQQYESSLKQKKKQELIKMQQVEAEVEEKRQALEHAVMEKSALDKLKQKHWEEYQVQELSAEQKITDDLNSFRYTCREALV